jgi:hypothetical protein
MLVCVPKTIPDQQQHWQKHRPRLEFGGNNGNKTGAMHGPLIDEGISLRCFWGISLLGGCLCLPGFFFFFYILRYRWV